MTAQMKHVETSYNHINIMEVRVLLSGKELKILTRNIQPVNEEVKIK